jgi:hypothetical protein
MNIFKINIIKNARRVMKISFETAGWLNGKLIFPVWDYDAIFLYDIITDKIENYENYNLIEFSNGPKYGSIVVWNNQIILCPLYSEDVVILQNNSDYVRRIKIKTSESPKDLFFESLVYNNSLYMFPGTYSSIVRIDLQTYEIQYFNDIVNKVRKKTSGNFIRHGIVQIDKFAYFACPSINSLIKFNLDTGYGELLDVKIEDNLSSVEISNQRNKIYILTVSGHLYITDLVLNRSELLYKSTHISDKIGFSEIQFDQRNNVIVIFPFEAENIKLYDITNNEMHTIKSGGETFWSSQYNGEIYAFINSENKLLKIDVANKCIKKTIVLDDDCVLMKQDKKFKLRHNKFASGYYQERDNKSLELYIKYIV